MELGEGADRAPSRARRWLAGSGCAAVGLALAALLVLQPVGRDRLADEVTQALGRSGVENPVTAVLLNFRAFDTMLELVVLLIVAVALRGMARDRGIAGARPDVPGAPVSPQLEPLVRDVVPLMVLVAGYLLWVGAYAPGGAFQAGAVLAAAAVLAWFTPRLRWSPSDGPATRLLLAAGPGAFLAAALAAIGVTGAYLAYPEGAAGAWILAIEAVATLSIAVVLYTMFLAVSGSPEAGPGADAGA
jgi:multisubunit Na+/H+ antiporter MnhB subunit